LPKKGLPESVLLDLVALLAYTFADDELHTNATRFMDAVEEQKVKTYISDVTPYEAEALFISGNVPVSERSWNSFTARLWQDPLLPRIPITRKVFLEHLSFYRKTGGRYTYFDSYYLATARVTGVPLVTADKEILSEKSITSLDLSGF